MNIKNKALEQLQDIISTDVKAGYESREAIIENAVDYLLGNYDPDWLKQEATRITDDLLLKHMQEQKGWIGETDCDRLDEAFAELDRHGIVARQHFTCCQTCGHRDINAEIIKTSKHRPVYGYVFFHYQDTESAVRSGYLYLAFGSISGKEADTDVIAKDIIASLRRAGLEIQWDGSIRFRICIKNLDWKRRRMEQGVL